MPEETESPEQIFSSQGLPFKSESIARSSIEKKGLNPDDYMVKSYQDGYIIVPKPLPVKEKYWFVTFNHKSKPDDEDDVTLIVNGEPLILKRGVQTIIPDRFKECADHATYPQFIQRPNEPRKIVGTMMVFPYSLHGEATAKEYFDLLKEGNKTTKEAREAAEKLI